MDIPKTVTDYKKLVEKTAGKKITIIDRKQHKDWVIKPRAFVDSDIVYVDIDLKPHDLEEALFHELTHVLFRYKGFPKVLPTKNIDLTKQNVLDKLLSLAEDLMVDRYLSSQNYPHDKYNYNKELSKITDIDESGSYIQVGGNNLPDILKMLVAELMFIRLLIDPNRKKGDIEKIGNICIKNLGTEEWEFIKKVSLGLNDIQNKPDSDQVKLKEMFELLIGNCNLNDCYIVIQNQK